MIFPLSTDQAMGVRIGPIITAFSDMTPVPDCVNAPTGTNWRNIGLDSLFRSGFLALKLTALRLKISVMEVASRTPQQSDHLNLHGHCAHVFNHHAGPTLREGAN